MTDYNSQPDFVSTVQLSPFGEDQWQRIVTYSPIYVHWTDMLLMTHEQRPQTAHVKHISKRLAVRDPIDINTLKLEDEILLNELQDMRKTVSAPGLTASKGKRTTDKSRLLDDIHDQRPTSPIDDYQTSSSACFQQTSEIFKHRGSHQNESLLTHLPCSNKRPVSSHQSISRPVISVGPIKKLSNVSLGSQPQPSLGVQLRQSAMARDHTLSAVYDHRSASPLSLYSSKRAASTLHSSQRQQPCRPPYVPSTVLPNEKNSSSSLHEQLTGESVSSLRRPRAKSSTRSRSAMHMLKTKNDRHRQKQQFELKSLLVEPWKQPSWTDGTLEESIPNSIDVMHKMCGPATPFERNLRQNYHRQLYQYRNGTTQC